MDWCLVTDIDGTLIGESESTRELRRIVLDARARLARGGARLRWVVATGRSYASTCEVLLESGFRLDDFDALITSVGAELYLTGETRPDPAYHTRLAATGFDAARVRAWLDRLGELELQPEHEQFPYKVCYFAKEDPALRQRVLRALSELPFKTTTVFAMGEYLDVAPEHGAKGGGVAHLLQRWGLQAGRAVAAGDSGNDLSMLEREWRAIVVGNGHDALRVLRGKPNVFFAQHKHAAGILEGLRALAFL
jgi:sucrose-6F-phosphate phosphohydrolase